MITGKIVALIAGAAVGAFAIGFAVTGSSSSTKPSSTTSAATWARATTIKPGDRVRFSLAQADLNVIAQAMGVAPDITGFETIMMSPEVATVLGSSQKIGYAPGDKLPPDWPSDDPKASAEYHAEFIYAGAAPIAVSSLPLPVLAWVASGGPPSTPASSDGDPTGYLDPASASTIVSRGVMITSIPAKAPTTGGVALFVYPTSPATLVAVTDANASLATSKAMALLASAAAQGDYKTQIAAIDGAHATQMQSPPMAIMAVSASTPAGVVTVGYLALLRIPAPDGGTQIVAAAAPTLEAAAAIASTLARS